MRVKICGVCRAQDAAVIAAHAADYIGVILAQRGPRQQTLESAARIYGAAGELMRVGVFADQAIMDIAATAQQLHLDVIQLHGNESAEFINELECETDAIIWKTVHLRGSDDLSNAIDAFADHVDGLLLDAEVGGSGRRFEWSHAQRAREQLPEQVTLIVAGGLTPENVQDAIVALQPDVVDVASGVEITTCQKSAEKVRDFITRART
jgi:phosphoribosylanthranilate isomerase